ncbi:specifically androgen-regulated gene protein-like isoform X2 [Narcine bancroftii]|uniref:specifically androgen-regulated gene protein-like isoform X2 n=1 Tax=Narcine bancroftii TaxID=1343680 RepID=UPI003831B886
MRCKSQPCQTIPLSMHGLKSYWSLSSHCWISCAFSQCEFAIKPNKRSYCNVIIFLWIGSSPMDSVASVNHVGDYSNETSHDSGHNDEFWNYLSVEERECLRFLEETIDSLSIEELERSETEPIKNGSLSEKLPAPHPETPHFQTTEPADKVPRAVSPLSKDSNDLTFPRVLESNSGLSILSEHTSKASSESAGLESNTGERSLTTVVPKYDQVKLGPPTAPKPGKLPPNIMLRSYHKNNDIASHPQSIYKVSKDGLQSNGAAKEGSTEGEAQRVRLAALAKLGLLSETNSQKKNHSDLVKTSSYCLSTGGNEMRSTHTEVDEQKNKLRGPRAPTVGTGLAPDKPENVKFQRQFPNTKSSSLKRFTTPGENIPPTTSFSSAHNTSASTALNAGTSKTLPIVKRSANVNEGHVRNASLPYWPLSSSKANSLKRFGSSGDNSQLASYSGLVPSTLGSAADASGLNKMPKARPMSLCSEADLSAKHGTTLGEVSSEKPARKFFPIKIHHISAKPHKSPPKGLNVQVVPQGPTNKDHKEALRKLGLLKE